MSSLAFIITTTLYSIDCATCQHVVWCGGVGVKSAEGRAHPGRQRYRHGFPIRYVVRTPIVMLMVLMSMPSCVNPGYLPCSQQGYPKVLGWYLRIRQGYHRHRRCLNTLIVLLLQRSDDFCTLSFHHIPAGSVPALLFTIQLYEHMNMHMHFISMQSLHWNKMTAQGTKGIFVPTRRRYVLYSSPKNLIKAFSSAAGNMMLIYTVIG